MTDVWGEVFSKGFDWVPASAGTTGGAGTADVCGGMLFGRSEGARYHVLKNTIHHSQFIAFPIC